MKKVIKVLLVLAVLFFYSPVLAEDVPPVTVTPPDPVTIHLTITNGANSAYDDEITVTACNSDNGATTEVKVTAYCAILQSGVESDWNWDWAPGAFLNSLADIAGYTSQDSTGSDVYHYWSWSLNGGYADVGLNQYDLVANDLISLSFVDPIEETPEVTPGEDETTEEQQSSSSGSRSSRKKEKTIFNLEKAFEFIISQQKEDGSFGEDLYTDWTALALATTQNYTKETIKLVKHFGELKISGTVLTDYERHAMALMALGLNPYNTNGENYIEKIVAGFDGKQFGDANEDNDDIFALIVLQNAGYDEKDKMILDGLSFILNRQKEDGSWDNSVDMTGAGIQALSDFKENESVKSALEKAKEFLEKNQKDNGGWSDSVSSTAWVQNGILALGEKPEDWRVDVNTPLDYLATMQDVDGGIKNENLENRIWQTAYVISALSDKTWNQIMQNFEKVEPLTTITVQPKQPTPKPKIVKPKTENLTNQNTATVINSVVPTSEPEIEDGNWFSKLLSKFFSVF